MKRSFSVSASGAAGSAADPIILTFNENDKTILFMTMCKTK